MTRKIIIAVTGASGSIYAKILLDKLSELETIKKEVGVVFSKNAQEIWNYELPGISHIYEDFKYFEKNDFSAPFASGSAGYDTMIICPCSMGSLGRIASGISDDLITRAADVMLKERKKLILVTRETPLNLIHIENMKKISVAGGIICPANPSFYSLPTSINELVGTVINRALDLSGIKIEMPRWPLSGQQK
ncbi:MAG: UbiX family flavin prenyltransferase [Bacteroidales bacterium]|nr:UbiX family flavin prenyltransferase [Bacteroidales bacterium]